MVRTYHETAAFAKTVANLDKKDWERIQKLIQKIIANPMIGKPMRYQRRNTREVYLKPFRLSYEYETHTDSLILLELYHKRKQ